jgi:23S rRNA (adenine2030-N6)-methyltransferase
VNYRHAYHAGNFADVLKHVVLVGLIEALKQKQKPFRYLDTHAGSARYSLTSVEAEKTREFASGIAPLLALSHLPSLLHIYLNVVRSFNVGLGSTLHIYPGSPLIAAALLRDSDRISACELQPDEARRLKAEFATDSRVECHQRNGYEALRALLPPKEKRGLVLIDPPYEAQLDEYDAILAGLLDAHQRWPTGIYAVWYPIKLRQDAEIFYRRLASMPYPNILVAELCLHQPTTALRLNGCGMVILNPPYRFDHTLAEILPTLTKALEQSRYGTHDLRWLKRD